MINQSRHVFLVLNFNTYKQTFELVESINNCNYECSIVIVDNGSSNNSFELLEEKYSLVANIIVLKSEANLGFARGNNLGYDYIKSNITSCEFIHCTNSDIILEQENMLELIELKYSEDDFFVAGPNVLTNDKPSSPMGIMNNKRDFQMYIKKLYIFTKVYQIIVFFFQKVMGNIIEETYQSMNAKKISKMQGLHENIPLLSGCFLTFSRPYIDKYDYLFLPITFLYCEESILTYNLIKNNDSLIKYYSDITVVHKHAGSSKENQKFKASCVLNNLKEMKKII